jgi:uncharacterized membrane protein YqiK
LFFWVALGLIFLLLTVFIISRFYRRASKELSFVRTGLGGEKVILDGGALKWPVFHEIIPVNMRTLRLQVDRKAEEGLITTDRMRVDVTAEFYVRVKPVQEAIAKAAQTLGNRTLEPDQLKELLQGKFVDALRSVAAGMTMEQLHEKRSEFVQSVQQSVSEDLLKNGLELESVSLTALDQTARQYFKEDNAFDAQGLAMLAQVTETKREERNRIEQETRVRIEAKNLEAAKQSLSLKRDEEFATLQQRREIDIATAEQQALIAKEQALRAQEAEEARISADQRVKAARIASELAIQQTEIEAKRKTSEAEVQREQAIEITKQTAAIAVARKSEEQSKAEAQASMARAERVAQDELVITVRETAVANREKDIRLIKAREEAEREAIEVMVKADAEKMAAADHAEATLTEARASADRIRLVAEADQKRFEVEAYGERAINEAKNLLSEAMIAFELRKVIANIAPELVAASVKPMEKIESIKVIQTNGFGNSGSNGAHPGIGSGASLPNQLLEAVLAYRMNLPLVETLLRELGLDLNKPEGLTSDLLSAVRPAEHPEVRETPGRIDLHEVKPPERRS